MGDMKPLDELFRLWQRRNKLDPQKLEQFHADLREMVRDSLGTELEHNAEYRVLKKHISDIDSGQSNDQ